MKKALWIFPVCALSLTTAFGQDDSYYQNNNAKGDNNYNTGSPGIPPANYNANIEQSIPPAGYYENNNSNNNNQPVNQPSVNQAPGNNAANNYSNSSADNNNANNNYTNQPAAPPVNNNTNSDTDNNAGNINNQPANESTNTNNGDDYANYQNFHSQLNTYGNWVNYPGYGNVWVPDNVPSDFSPYATAGHWVYTTYGWSWVSDYAWGGIPFHYGRWFRDNAYGWMWMPGYQWASAWVTWGNYNNYYCWAPLAPYTGFSAYYRPNPFCWNFCDRAHFCDFHLGLYRGFYGRGDYRGIAAHINVMGESRMYGGHAYFAGPRVGEVERSVGHSISPYSANHANQNMAAHNNSGSQFHQQANANQNHGQNFANHNNNVQSNHFANNDMQNHAKAQQYNRGNNNTARANNGAQYQRSNNGGQRQVQQHSQYSGQSHSAQSYRAPQASSQRSQPVQRQSERSFASAQRSSSHGSARSGGGGSHGSRR